MPDLSLLFLLAIILAGLAFILLPWYRLRKALQQPFPEAWRRILARNFPVYRRMPTNLQLQLKKLIRHFLHEKTFIGCAGQAIDDEVRVTIAASACILLLNRRTSVYAGLKYILVYPEAFVVERDQVDEAGLHAGKRRGLLGESWSNGKVILSWADVRVGNRQFNDGQNVGLHEFAHQLDHETGATAGAPLLDKSSRYRRWAQVMTREFEALQRAAFNGDPTLLSQYGATEPAEFFAVVTEVFFEQPQALAQQHPALFEELHQYYRVDPREWA
ncbi:MAG TPA: zinc-dependent peptidase [Thiolinea sp.]|nr:zinc-dependent peptidase [Thiolinea sp.]